MTSDEQRHVMIATSIKCRGWVIAKTGFDAEDVLQSSLLKGFQAIAKLGDKIICPQAFFVSILKNEICSLFRTRMGRKLDVEISRLKELHLPDTKKRPDELLLAKEERRILANGMDRLPNRSREVIDRFYLQDEPKPKSAAAMGLTERNFLLVKTRAKAKLVEMRRSENASARLKQAAKKAA